MNERNKILKESYYFDCACYQCLAEKAIQKDLTDVLCEKCEEGYLVGLK
jgi:Zn finger protein HypA/HybF involved in hydrogenase expression